MLRPIVEATRRQGYAVTGSEFTEGLVGGAVPVMSPQGALLGCLNMFSPAVRLSENDVYGLIPLLKHTSYKITEALEFSGGQLRLFEVPRWEVHLEAGSFDD